MSPPEQAGKVYDATEVARLLKFAAGYVGPTCQCDQCQIVHQLSAAAKLIEELQGQTEADEVSIYGMFDCHLFHRYTGSTVDEVIDNWLAHIGKPIPARFEGGETTDDLGPTELCPATVLAGGKELRRVGEMVFTDSKTRKPRKQSDVDAFRAALLADPDIPRLLAQTKGNAAKEPK